jgi:hypothetical protein
MHIFRSLSLLQASPPSICMKRDFPLRGGPINRVSRPCEYRYSVLKRVAGKPWHCSVTPDLEATIDIVWEFA